MEDNVWREGATTRFHGADVRPRAGYSGIVGPTLRLLKCWVYTSVVGRLWGGCWLVVRVVCSPESGLERTKDAPLTPHDLYSGNLIGHGAPTTTSSSTNLWRLSDGLDGQIREIASPLVHYMCLPLETGIAFRIVSILVNTNNETAIILAAQEQKKHLVMRRRLVRTSSV
jgi:hypothetical protein